MRRKVWFVIAVVAALVLIAYFAASWFVSSLAIATPTTPLAEARAQVGEPTDFGLPTPEDVAIDTGEVTLRGWYFDNPAEGNCGVMFMHGFTGTRYEALYWAPLFWPHGCDLLAYDHRGHGDSSPVIRLLMPGALWVAGLRGHFDVDAVSPETAIAAAKMPVLLIHSRTDNFTPYTHSEAIFANSDQSHTVLHINDWGSPHAADIGTDFDAYQALFEAFLAQYAPDFGLPLAQ